MLTLLFPAHLHHLRAHRHSTTTPALLRDWGWGASEVQSECVVELRAIEARYWRVLNPSTEAYGQLLHVWLLTPGEQPQPMSWSEEHPSPP